jgi:antitoxin component YwqK of YwqJK toxin-antitoxin module
MNQFNRKGQRHGPWEEYFSNGQLQQTNAYMNGDLHGDWESYYQNGALRTKGTFVNGLRHGLWEEYWHDAPLVKVKYINNEPIGPVKSYWANGDTWNNEFYL